MRSEGSSLDLNNLPEDYIRDGKQLADDNSNGHRKKKSGTKEGKDESGKVYECRFCSLKFCKSQALGGHMNRHRQERETETLNRARQLVFSNDNLAAQPSPHLGCCHSLTPGSYHSTATAIGSDPTLPLRFPTRMFPPSSSSTLLPPQPHPVPPPPPPPQPHQPYLYTSPSRPSPFPPYYPTQHPLNEYYVGHVFGNASQCSHPSIDSNNYTCIGAPVGHAASFSGGTNRVLDTSTGGGRDGTTLQGNEEEGVNWGRSAYAGTQQRMDVGSSINRFQDGF